MVTEATETTEEVVDLIPSPIIKKTLGARIRALRKARGYSRDDVQEELGIHWDLLRRIEIGERDVEITLLIELAEFLKEDPIKLIRREYSVSVG